MGGQERGEPLLDGFQVSDKISPILRGEPDLNAVSMHERPSGRPADAGGAGHALRLVMLH